MAQFYDNLSAAARETYIEKGGFNCPFCESADLEPLDSPDINEGVATQLIKCKDCLGTWNDIYTMADVKPLASPSRYRINDAQFAFVVTREKAEDVIESRIPRSLFLVIERDRPYPFVAIDNSSGNANTESFEFLNDALGWLNGQEDDFEGATSYKS